VTIIDANVLLYAYNADAPEQRAAEQWLTMLLASGDTVAIPWVTVWAFLRISTNARIWLNPLHAKQVFEVVGEWLAQPNVVLLQPGPRHASLLERVILEHGIVGPLVTDAVLTAMALENGATVASTDEDFRRFPEIRWVNPVKQ
jgi:uncharacterized protein